MEEISAITKLQSFLPVLITTTLVIVLFIYGNRAANKHYEKHHEHRYRKQLVSISIFIVGLLAIIVVLPISEELRGQLLSLIGIILSATIALSSTTFVGNAMAGIMLRSVSSFKIGDFIRVADNFGRVSEMGLLHIEIQTEDRDLMTIPNLYVVTQPTKVIHADGTIISAEVSLGYDLNRTVIENLLLDAARAAELEDPYVLILNLGDFSVTYQINGLLPEVKQLISVRSILRKRVLDALHMANIEIVSPTIMNTRGYPADKKFVPTHLEDAPSVIDVKDASPEKIVFDKAEEAESLESTRQERSALKELIKEIEASLKQPDLSEDQLRKLNTELRALLFREERLVKIITSAMEKTAQK